ncbi:MAG TPA: S-adenosylmethionine:tRNA ribosyltransferase-isomerase [Bacteroidales bacterium]|nr:S-adenosylmethionine:tRNA ribosyltransferase-isomerase [Bacteroidales bacterium]
MHKALHININDFDYSLPEERIAKYPLDKRDTSKLLIMKNNSISSEIFKNINNYLPSNSLIVFNNSKVIKARLHFNKDTGSLIEIFCLEPVEPINYNQSLSSNKSCCWKCLIGNNKKWKSGELEKKINIKNSEIVLSAIRLKSIGNAFEVQFSWDNPEIVFSEILKEFGEIPIPPYLNRKSEEIDKTRYQTVYSAKEGSVAAPTAGFHFTDEVFSELNQKNITSDYITLHVGAGTFQPVKADNISEHQMHTEHFIISKNNIENLIQYYGNTTVVGTTTVRSLESLFVVACKVFLKKNIIDNHFFIAQWESYYDEIQELRKDAVKLLNNLLEWMKTNKFEQLNCTTQIMIIPGYNFFFTNRLITNFHQPKSTLLLLLSAFVGNKWKEAYDYALKNDFRFLSYGDSCLFLS